MKIAPPLMSETGTDAPREMSPLTWGTSSVHSTLSGSMVVMSHNGNENGTTLVYRGNIGIMEKQMETTIVYWGYIGVLFQV